MFNNIVIKNYFAKLISLILNTRISSYFRKLEKSFNYFSLTSPINSTTKVFSAFPSISPFHHSIIWNNIWNINKNGESVALQESIPPFAINQTRIRTHPFSTRPPSIRHPFVPFFFSSLSRSSQKGGWNRQRWRVNSKQRVATTLRKQKGLVIDYRKNSLSSMCPCPRIYIHIQY